jgi:hypothetical protein
LAAFQAFKDLLTIGRGSILFHPDYKLENRGKTLVLTGVPMLLRSGTKFENLAALTNVAQYVDETTIETGIRIVVEAKRGVVWNETTMKPVLNLFSSRVAFRINYLMETTTEVDGAVVVDSKLVSNGVIDAMYDWIELRKEQFDITYSDREPIVLLPTTNVRFRRMYIVRIWKATRCSSTLHILTVKR